MSRTNTRASPIIPGLPWWTGGLAAITVIAALTLLPLFAMLLEAGNIAWAEILADPYIQRVIRFSFWQATLSTLLSLLVALPVALSLAHLPDFPGRRQIVSLFSLSLVIPTIVAIYGIVAVFGRTGWISTLLEALSLSPLEFYGLPGILIAHVFFNMPLATRVLLINLEGIPREQWRLATQLGMGPVGLFQYIEWPIIRSQLPGLAVLIFTLCFTSFAIVMTLGGGPRATTIEVAIYQSLRFDFDLALAVALASIQLLACIILMLVATLFKQDNSLGFESLQAYKNRQQKDEDIALKNRLWDQPLLQALQTLALMLASLLVILPLAALLISSVNSKTLAVLTDPLTISALVNTVIASLSSAVAAVVLAILLLLSSRHLRIRLHYERAGQWLNLSGNVILVFPPLVLGTGLFLLLRPFADVFSIALILVIVINSLLALPFVLRILEAPLMRTASHYDHLVQSLGITGLARWRILDWPQLRRPLALGLALSATLSAGDLSAIALFGSDRVTTLPLLLYQRMGSYRLEEAAVTAGLLLLLCLFMFAALQRLVGGGLRADAG